MSAGWSPSFANGAISWSRASGRTSPASSSSSRSARSTSFSGWTRSGASAARNSARGSSPRPAWPWCRAPGSGTIAMCGCRTRPRRTCSRRRWIELSGSRRNSRTRDGGRGTGEGCCNKGRTVATKWFEERSRRTETSCVRKLDSLQAWTVARQVARSAYRLTLDPPLNRHFGLTDQIRRAAASIPANIAEGYALGTTAQFIRFLRIALGSGTELCTHLELVRDLALAPTEGVAEALELR